jgi:hypothetical protein
MWLAVSSTCRNRSKYATAEGRYSTPTPSSVGMETPSSSESFSSVSILTSSPRSNRYNGRARYAQASGDFVGGESRSEAERLQPVADVVESDSHGAAVYGDLRTSPTMSLGIIGVRVMFAPNGFRHPRRRTARPARWG